MDLTDCSREELLRVVQNLIDEGVVAEGDIQLPDTKDEKNAADILHTLICKSPHVTGHCEYYLGGEINKWVRRVKYLCRAYNLTAQELIAAMEESKKAIANDLTLVLIGAYVKNDIYYQNMIGEMVD